MKPKLNLHTVNKSLGKEQVQTNIFSKKANIAY